MIGVRGQLLTGRRVLVYLLGFFGLVFAVNGVFVYLALSSFNGVHTENAYLKGLDYNATIDAAEKQSALGWRSTTTLRATERATGQGGLLTVTMRTADDRPIDGLDIDGVLMRPTHAGADRPVVFRQVGAGRYDADLELPFPGQWELRMTATARDGSVYKTSERLWLE